MIMKSATAALAAGLVAVPLLAVAPGPARSDNRLAIELALTCNKELKRYCSTVTTGGGRKLACLFAHNDKLGFLCERSMLKAGALLEQAIVGLNKAAHNCAGDIDRFCARAVPGQGRVAMCLAAHQPSLSPICAASLDALRQGRR